MYESILHSVRVAFTVYAQFLEIMQRGSIRCGEKLQDPASKPKRNGKSSKSGLSENDDGKNVVIYMYVAFLQKISSAIVLCTWHLGG